MMNRAHWLPIRLFVEFGNPSVRAFLISGWWIQLDALSYRSRVPRDVLQTSEMDKKHKYSQACQD